MIDNETFEDIITELKISFPTLSKLEMERICNSQFRVIRDTMSNRKGKVIQLIHFGKFRPTMYNQDYLENLKLKNNE